MNGSARVTRKTTTPAILLAQVCRRTKRFSTTNPLIASTTEGLEVNRRKCIVADEATGMTSKENVYAGGDAVTGAATVILAMGAGKTAAKGIHEYLSEE